MYMYVLELIKQVVIVPVLHYIFQTANHSPVFPQLNQSKITFCSPLIGPFKFQPLSLVNIQKRISSPSQENILFLLSLVNQNAFAFTFNHRQTKTTVVKTTTQTIPSRLNPFAVPFHPPLSRLTLYTPTSPSIRVNAALVTTCAAPTTTRHSISDNAPRV